VQWFRASCSAHRPFIVLLQQDDDADQADDRLLVGEDADDVGG
jgi:hypothetical protein